VNIVYQINKPIKAEDLADVFMLSGIKRPVDQLERLEKMIEHADIIVTAWDEDTLVGVARAITDFSYCCYLSDLAVRRDYQKKGIGKELITRLQAEIGEEVALLLLAAPDAMNYYPHIGFKRAENAFLIPRKK
jgi:N-acetylglutamate synthase-like GNAT family acetyltransferase